MWFLADVIGLFSNKVGSFSLNLVPNAPILSAKVVPKNGCNRFLGFMLSGRYIYHAFSLIKTTALTDELTSLYNRRAFMELLGKQFQQGRRGEYTFCLIMADCDNLKIVNDIYGHEAGNLLLQALARNFRHCLRGCDSAARYGGDEFTVLLPNTSLETAEMVANRLKETMVASGFNYNGNVITTSISVGIASFPQHGDTEEALLRHADEAMYANKRKSKNQVTAQ
jgi:diguanylate cyclase (GGDEF)-like protein